MERIVDIARLAGERDRKCGHTNEYGNPNCPNMGRYGLFDGSILIRCRCRQHMAELSDD